MGVRAVALLTLAALLLACGPGGEGPPRASGSVGQQGGAPPASAAGGSATPTAGRSLERVVIGVPGVSLSYLPTYLAWKFGYFEEEGLAPEFVPASGNVFVPAMLSGEMDFTTNLSSIGTHAGQGGPTKIVQFQTVRLQHALTVRPDITTPQQLEGKRVAILSLGTLPAFEVQKLAEHFGLRDVAMVVAGGEMERIAAIEAGAADAAISSIPANLVAERRGIPTLLRVGTVLDVPQAGLGTTDANLRDRADFVTRTLRAAARALPAVHARRDDVIQIIAQWIELSPEDAARAYEQVADTFSPNGLATEAQLRAYLQLMQETANVPADATFDRLYDFTIARRVAQELGLPLP